MIRILVFVVLTLSGCRAHHEGSNSGSNTLDAENIKSSLKTSVAGKSAPIGDMKGLVISVTLDRTGDKDDTASREIGQIVLETVASAVKINKPFFTVVAIDAKAVYARESTIKSKIKADAAEKIANAKAFIQTRVGTPITDDQINQLYLMVFENDSSSQGVKFKDQFFGARNPDRGQLMVAIVEKDGSYNYSEMIPLSKNTADFEAKLKELSDRMKTAFID